MTTEPLHPGANPEPVLPRVCLDCGATLTDRWCASCGQEDRPLDPSLRDLVREAVGAFTNLDGPVMQSLARLYGSPGFLTREYLAGRRTRWVTPVRLYLVLSVVYFGLASLTGWAGFSVSADATGDTPAETQAELTQLGFASESELDQAAQTAVVTWLPRAMFLLVPIFAGLFAVARWRARRAYPHHLTFSLHAHAALFGALTISALAEGAFGVGRASGAVSALVLLYGLAYLVISSRRVYGGGWLRSLGEGVVVGSLYLAVTMAITVAIILPVVVRG